MVTSECGKRNGVLSDEPGRPDIIADSPPVFLERQSAAGEHLRAYVSVCCVVQYRGLFLLDYSISISYFEKCLDI
jgi:hypothetical protein